jgi:hypothetical protein
MAVAGFAHGEPANSVQRGRLGRQERRWASYDPQMSKSKPLRGERKQPSDSEVLGEWQQGMLGWAGAVEAHKMAPPDEGFAARLRALAEGAREAARVSRSADAAGFELPISAQ